MENLKLSKFDKNDIVASPLTMEKLVEMHKKIDEIVDFINFKLGERFNVTDGMVLTIDKNGEQKWKKKE